ncbi:MAG TPA: O-acetyl-ADP-ribose deacetylase [Ohtaekwangia sp.]|nr:O-acetyl-ADP-ribose deacetylase [Ohtaekwangia sp.]
MKRVEVIMGDITALAVDAIVNAANSGLRGGGGVDGAIHRKGGPRIMEECDAIRNRQGGCPTGEAVITPAGMLPAKYVIHTVGPVWQGGRVDEDRLLANAYTNSLRLAVEHDIHSLAFPNISTGVYGFPKGRAAQIATDTVREFLKRDTSLKRIIFCCFDEENYKIYTSILET